jgi:hypothetical protein
MKKAHFLIKCARGQPPTAPNPFTQSSPSRSLFVRSHVRSVVKKQGVGTKEQTAQLSAGRPSRSLYVHKS